MSIQYNGRAVIHQRLPLVFSVVKFQHREGTNGRGRLSLVWGGARVVEWGRLLSGCWDYKSQPQVRILSSPLSRMPA